jgi:hypothetical protein
MATSSAYIKDNPASIPVPKLRIVRPADTGASNQLSVILGSPQDETPFPSMIAKNLLQVTAYDVPEELFDPKYGLQVELLRYRRRSSSTVAFPSPARAGNAGIIHPIHGPGASGNGSFTRGGLMNNEAGGNLPLISAIRPTEWAVTSNNQIVDVSQGCAGFMELNNVKYRTDPNSKLLDQTGFALIPSGLGLGRVAGRRFAYGGNLFPGRFWFRYSIIDTADTHTPKKRISGPLTGTPITLANHVFPFLTTFTSGSWPIAAVNPLFDFTALLEMAFHNGERLP